MTRGLLTLTAMLIVACDSTTDAGGSARDVRGVWSYSGSQTSPSLNITGTLQIDQQDGAEFSGTVTFQEADVQGTIRDRTGPLSGRVLGADAVDFDIFIDQSSRRHVAGVTSDSMNGSWARTGTNPPVTGSFSARKTR